MPESNASSPKSSKTVLPPPPDVVKKFGLGLNPDKPEHQSIKSVMKNPLDITSHRALLGAPLRVAQEVTLEDLIEKIWNQSTSESCVSWAYAQNAFLRCKKIGTPIEMPAPFSIYTPARALERAANGIKPGDQPLQDTGSSPWLAAQAMYEWGTTAMSAWPFDLAKINDEPDFAKIELMSAFRLQMFVPIMSTGKQLCADIDQSLSEGFPVVVCATVDKAFMDYNGKSVVGAPDLKNLVGGHAMNCVAKRSDGTHRILNQWDKTWGDNGMATVNDDFFTNPNFIGAFVLPVHATGHNGSIFVKPEEKAQS